LWPFIEDMKTKLIHVLSTGLRRGEVAPATQAGMKPCATGSICSLSKAYPKIFEISRTCHPEPCPEFISGLFQDLTKLDQ